jgi:DNA-binding transcriptional ArsR family regulator
LRVCENRAKNIEAIMTRSIKRAEHQGKLFTTIAERVKAFYVEKGKTVANYDELVAAVDSAKTTLDTHLAALKEVEFACDSDDPKGSIDSFKEAHQQVLTDLKALRTAVKNLIVGVRSAQGSDS